MASPASVQGLFYTKIVNKDTSCGIRWLWNQVTVSYNRNEPGKITSFHIKEDEDIIQLQFLLTCRFDIVKPFLAQEGVDIKFEVSDHNTCEICLTNGPQPQSLKVSFMKMLKSHFLSSVSPYYICDKKTCEQIRNKCRDRIPKLVEDKRAYLIENLNGIVCISDSSDIQNELLLDLDVRFRRHFQDESDVLADYICKFGKKLINDCKSNFDVDLKVCEKQVRLEGNLATSIDNCTSFITDQLKGQCAFIPLLASDFQFTHGIIQSVTEQKKCCWKLHSMVEPNSTRDCYAEYKAQNGSCHLSINNVAAKIKTDMLIMLTTDILFTPADGYLKPVIASMLVPGGKRKRNVGDLGQVPLNEITLNEHVCCKEVWVIVCVQMENNNKIKQVIQHKSFQKSVEIMLQHAETRQHSDLCIVASLLDSAGQQFPLTAFAKKVVAAVSVVEESSIKKSFDIRVGQESKSEAIQAFNSAFNEKHKVFKMTPWKTPSKEVLMEVLLGNVQDSKFKADIIVCTSNPELSFNGQYAQAIQKLAGEEMLQDCRKKYPNGIPPCFVAHTRSFQLKQRKVKYIFHVALPKYSVKNFQKVKEMIQNCLYLADELQCKSIAFPALGVGGLKYPRRETAFQLFEGVQEYITKVPLTKLKCVKIFCFEGDRKTCEAFTNEEHRQSCKEKNPEGRTLYSGDVRVQQTYIGQGNRVAVRVMLRDNACFPAYAVTTRFISGKDAVHIKGATEKPATLNDQLHLPLEIGANLIAAHRLLEEERVTHLILKLDSTDIPDWKMVDVSIQIIQSLATSCPRFLRIVDVVVLDKPNLDGFLFKSGLTRWMSVAPQYEPSFYLELIAESSKCLDEIRTTVERNIYDEHKTPILKETTDIPNDISLEASKLKDKHGTHGHQNHTVSSLESIKEMELDPSYATIGEINAPQTYHDQTNMRFVLENVLSVKNDCMDDDPTYDNPDEKWINSNSPKTTVAHPDTSIAKDTVVLKSFANQDPKPLSKRLGCDAKTDYDDISTHDATLIHESEVTAFINPGLVDYLEQQNKLHTWKSSVERKFNVRICGENASYTVYGAFDDIIAFESYLQKFIVESLEFDLCDDYFSEDNTLLENVWQTYV